MYQAPTIGGHDYWEALSALQKAVRRGLTDEAVYWVTEIALSGRHKAAAEKMFVFAAEEVSIGAPNLVCELVSLHKIYLYRYRNGGNYLALANHIRHPPLSPAACAA